MAIAPRNYRRPSIDIWPGFVDALSQLLMVIIFILLVFTVGQFYLSAALSGREEALHKLQQQVDALASLLSLERTANGELREGSARLQAQLKSASADRQRLNAQVSDLSAKAKETEKLRDRADELEASLAAEQQQAAITQKAIADRDARLQQLTTAASQGKQALAAEKSVSSEALAQVDLLNQQIAALRQQLSAISAALDLSQAKVKTQQTQIADLGQKLNIALANKVEELAHYRSEFFGRLRDILGNRPDIRVVGDRFVFQSEVLFAPGSADLTDNAKKDLDPVITALKQITAEIPPDINWVLQVSGHTDRNPIKTPQFPSNWELSTARAMSVVRYAISKGIPADRLAAAGFADTQPIDPGTGPDAYRRNRRIELKLTER
ncbi:MAG TPA: peptidoglycan -binding protein [Stellaceae bacterium]|jgi:chemotaxis protein MotB|nr:peptidoglycan -binding protein [Stellaceae bacterium]